MSDELTQSLTTRSAPDGSPVASPRWSDQLAAAHLTHDSDVDPWSWVDAEEIAPAAADLSRCRVTAVLVTLDAEDWLPETLAALAHSQVRPTRLIAIDNDSLDSTRALLDRALEQGLLAAVYDGRRGQGFGASVSAALAADARPPGTPPPGTPPPGTPAPATSAQSADGPRGVGRQDFLWLLHDDAAPAPDALGLLMSHLVGERSVDITGPKLLYPRRRRTAPQLGEVGTTISGTGRRELMLEPGEIDQGQRDQAQQRLGVSTCGMLIRRTVFEQLGGFDPDVPVFRDGVELGWRAHLLGHRVVTTPAARMSHRQVGRAGLRPGGAGGRRPGKVDRELGMVVVAGHASGPRLPLVWLRLVWSCLLHALGYLLGKAPGRARDELAAMGSFIAHPGRIAAMRRRVAALPVAEGSRAVVRTLRPPWWSSLRVLAEAVTGAVSERYRSLAGDMDASSLDELTGDDFAATREEPTKYPWLAPAVVVTVVAVVGSLIAARGLIGVGSLSGPALLPAPDSLGLLWREAVSPIPGAPGQTPPPWLALVALAATVLAGQPEWLVTLLLCAVVPGALLSVYPVLRHLVAGRRVRVWAASTYALLPVLLGSSNQGRLSLSVFAVLLPMLLLAVRGLVLRRPGLPEAWRGAWGAGVVLVVLVAFEPSMIILALLAGVVGAVRLRRQPRKVGRIGIAVGLPLLVLAPWSPTILMNPGRLFVGPDAAVTGLRAAPPVWGLLIGRETGSGLPPLWLGAVVFGAIWLVALAGLVRHGHRSLVRTAFGLAVLALALAVAISRMVVTVPPLGLETRPWSGVYLLIAFGALVVCGAAGIDQVGAAISRRSFSWLQPVSALAAVGLGLTTLGAAVWWAWAGAGGPLDRSRVEALPPYVRNAMLGDSAVRVLAIDLDGARVARWTVIADDGLRLGDADRGYAFGGSAAATDQAQDLVLRMVAGTADADIAPQLRELGIGYVWVKDANGEQQARIDNTPGLGPASGSLDATVWQLQGSGSRRSLAGASGVSALPGDPPSVPAGTDGRSLRLGEAADPRWQASVGGVPLAPGQAGWQQTFALPAAGGVVEVGLASTSTWWLIGQGSVLLVAAVLAAPGIRRPDVRDPTSTARRAASIGRAL